MSLIQNSTVFTTAKVASNPATRNSVYEAEHKELVEAIAKANGGDLQFIVWDRSDSVFNFASLSRTAKAHNYNYKKVVTYNITADFIGELLEQDVITEAQGDYLLSLLDENGNTKPCKIQIKPRNAQEYTHTYTPMIYLVSAEHVNPK